MPVLLHPSAAVGPRPGRRLYRGPVRRWAEGVTTVGDESPPARHEARCVRPVVAERCIDSATAEPSTRVAETRQLSAGYRGRYRPFTGGHRLSVTQRTF